MGDVPAWDDVDEREARRRRNSVVLVVVAAVLCVIGGSLAFAALTGGGGTIEPAGGADPVAGAGAPAPTAPAPEPAAPGAGPQAGAGDAVAFSSPTGNIGCVLDSSGARCDIAERSWQPPAQPAECTLDWGQGLVVEASGAGYVCAGDSVLGATTVLEYGATAQRGSVRCTSSESGMRCEDTGTGHGFDVARAAVEIF